MKRIFRFLKGTVSFGLAYKGDGNLEASVLYFKVFSDSDWAGDAEKRRFTAVYVFIVIEGVIVWSSKKL